MQVLVIGAGVVGLAVARTAALAGHDVTVAEMTGGIANGVSSRNSEVIHAGLYYPTNSLRARHCVRGRRHALRILRVAWRPPSQMRQARRRHQRGRAGEGRDDLSPGADERRRRRRDDRRQCRARAWKRSCPASARCGRRKPASSTATPICGRYGASSKIAAA